MRGLPTLIRLSRRAADERRAALAAAERARAAAEEALARHDAVGSAEAAAVRGDPAAMADWIGWAAQAARRRTGLAESAGALARQEETAREAVREGFAEVKRLELALDAAEREARRRAARRAEAAAEDSELRRPRE